ncbi:carbohydrate-binding module family 20 domain-containing protein [Streptomyces sp. NPDC048253]|uniref:carbohydrate-binding module family 20 domain-containing protein n=1 Tax=Streptomyces sp. NPDC048253 TaxID=3365524 RepID=UPI00371FE659
MQLTARTFTANATDVTFNVTATTSLGTNVYVVGSLASLGSWNPADAVPLSSASYPTWSSKVIVPRPSRTAHCRLRQCAVA